VPWAARISPPDEPSITEDEIQMILEEAKEIGIVDPTDPTAVRRPDGSWLVDGKLSIEDFKQLFDISVLPDEAKNLYQTVGGFVMSYLGRVPQAGDSFEWQNMKIEVVDMDWRRVDKVLVTPAAGTEDSSS
jgi:putative hemolysin